MIPIKGYLRLYQQYRSERAIHQGEMPDYSESVASVWRISINIIQQEDPAAFEILQLCAFLWPNAIPYEIFIEDAVLQSPVTSLLVLYCIITVLRRYSLVEVDSDRDTLVSKLSIHPVFQEVLLDEMDNDTQRLWAVRAVRAVSRFLFSSGQANSQEMFLHAQKCVDLIKQWNMTLPEAEQLSLYINDSF